MNNYDDIIDLPHYVSNTHPRMSLENRSVQFSPFAALTGYSDSIKETERLTQEKIIFDEEHLEILDSKLLILNNKIKTKPEVTIIYFVPDIYKQGGVYKTINTSIKRIDFVKRQIILINNQKILIDDIYDIKSCLFNYLDY